MAHNIDPYLYFYGDGISTQRLIERDRMLWEEFKRENLGFLSCASCAFECYTSEMMMEHKSYHPDHTVSV